MSRYLIIGAHLLEEDLGGVEAVEAIPLADLFLSGYRFDDHVDTASRELLLSVADARKRLLENEVFVAIRFGLSVANAAQAEEKCRSYVNQWRALLEKYRGRVELTLRIAGTADAPARPDRSKFSSGRDYLMELQRLQTPARLEPELAAAVEQTLAGAVDESRWQRRDDGGWDVAFITQRDRISEVALRAESLKERLKGRAFLLSGPWPLEAFATDE